jgi:hypothetical protein
MGINRYTNMGSGQSRGKNEKAEEDKLNKSSAGEGKRMEALA